MACQNWARDADQCWRVYPTYPPPRKQDCLKTKVVDPLVSVGSSFISLFFDRNLGRVKIFCLFSVGVWGKKLVSPCY